jgi:DNA-binding transcriptional regulator YdaS (Cro superfamily)
VRTGDAEGAPEIASNVAQAVDASPLWAVSARAQLAYGILRYSSRRTAVTSWQETNMRAVHLAGVRWNGMRRCVRGRRPAAPTRCATVARSAEGVMEHALSLSDVASSRGCGVEGVLAHEMSSHPTPALMGGRLYYGAPCSAVPSRLRNLRSKCD